MDINFSYESHNQTSYLLATFPPSQNLIQYQLQMMVSNDIKGLLPSTKRQSNDNILVYYNITSKISLSQILNRRKLTKKEFLTLLTGAADVWTEIQEYQLESDGLYLDKDYIFVNSDSCEPSFVYLPVCVSSNGVKNLKEFIQRMIIEGSIETSMDNFVQVLLNALNDPAFDVKKLRDCIKKLNGNQHVENVEVKSQSIPQPQPVQKPKPVSKPEPEPQPAPIPNIPRSEAAQIPEPLKKEVKEKSKNSDKKAVKGDGQKKFILCQAVFIVAIAAMISFGLLNDVTNIAGAVIAIAGLEFVLYREFMTKKDPDDKKKKPVKNTKKPEKKKSAEKRTSGHSVVIPGAEPQQREPEIPSVSPVKYEVPPTVQPVMPAAEPIAPAKKEMYFSGQAETDALTEDAQPVNECEETEFWDPSKSSEKYLEYSNDGQTVKIPLVKESTLLGRLASQVDFAVNNPKVGKIHAEIVMKDGSCYIKDLNSKNGTYLNGSGERIASNMPYSLENGTRIALADSEFVYHC